jgi:hypothetical protein
MSLSMNGRYAEMIGGMAKNVIAKKSPSKRCLGT